MSGEEEKVDEKEVEKEFGAELESGDKSDLVAKLLAHPTLRKVLTHAKAMRDDFLTNLPEEKRELGITVINEAQNKAKQMAGRAITAAATTVAGTGTGSGEGKREEKEEEEKKKGEKKEKKPEDVDYVAGVLKKAAYLTFYENSPAARSISRTFRATQAVVIILWIITLVLIGLTVWRATLPPPVSSNGVSVGIYVATGYTLLIAIAALIIYEAGVARVKKEVDETFDYIEGIFKRLGAKRVLARLAQIAIS